MLIRSSVFFQVLQSAKEQIKWSLLKWDVVLYSSVICLFCRTAQLRRNSEGVGQMGERDTDYTFTCKNSPDINFIVSFHKIWFVFVCLYIYIYVCVFIYIYIYIYIYLYIWKRLLWRFCYIVTNDQFFRAAQIKNNILMSYSKTNLCNPFLLNIFLR